MKVARQMRDNSPLAMRRTVFLTVLFLLSIVVFYYATSTATEPEVNFGTITGQLVDEQTGEALIGATVMLENTVLGAASDLDGRYTVSKIPPGTYNLIVRLIGYSNVTVKSVQVSEGQSTRINLTLSSEAYKTHDVVVVARSIDNTEAALLKNRQRSSAISDAISAESFERSGSGNAAEAMSRVTGASVVDDKYVFVRGLGERYSNAHLNGAELPSSDPDKKAFQMDLLPSNMLDNIVVIKSFTADQPGNFSGGIIDIGTRTFPESFTLKFSSSSSYNMQTSLNHGFLTYPGGHLDWLAMDDGTRDIPDELNNASIPDISFAFSDPDEARMLNDYSRAFNSTMAPATKTAPVNQSYAFSIGNKVNLFERRLGYLASFNYGRNYSSYENGEVGRWRLSGNASEATSLTKDFYLSDAMGKDEVNWGGLFMTSYKLNDNNEVGTNFILSKSGESEARYLSGQFFDGNLPEDATYETRVLKYTERTLASLQLNGRHHLGNNSGMDLDWNGTYSRNTQSEPDLRYFSDHYTASPEGDTTYTIRPSIYTVPQRFFRDLSEDHLAVDFKISIPFRQWSDLPAKFRFGGYLSRKTRDSHEKIFEYQNQDPNAYDGDPGDFFSDENTGIIDSSGGIYTFGNYIVDASELRSNYTGEQTIAATFGVVESPITDRLRFIGGLRFERTRIDVVTEDPSYDPGKLDDNDLLPSGSLVYGLNDKTNLRAAYGRTLARPTFRELAPFPSWDFANGYYFIGNPDLKRTLIDNVDLRLEWFDSPGEIVAASVFAKRFQNPIERAIKNDNGEIQYQNVEEAFVYGLELELRQKLDVIHGALSNFLLGGNFSLIKSRVDIPESEMIIIRTYDPGADRTRPLQGQSPYLLNVDLTYDNINSGTMGSLSFSVFGERLSAVSLGGTPDIYELPRPDLGLVLGQRIFGGLEFKFSARNLLDSSIEKVHHFKDQDYVYQTYKRGRTFLIGLSYSIE